MVRRKSAKSTDGATLGFEQTLWQVVDKIRGYVTLYGDAVRK